MRSRMRWRQDEMEEVWFNCGVKTLVVMVSKPFDLRAGTNDLLPAKRKKSGSILRPVKLKTLHTRPGHGS